MWVHTHYTPVHVHLRQAGGFHLACHAAMLLVASAPLSYCNLAPQREHVLHDVKAG